MSLKKYLRNGQAAFEYLVLLALIAGLILLSGGFLSGISSTGDSVFRSAAGRILN